MTSNTISTLKFLAIAGVGLFVDGYLNVSIGLVVPMIGYLYFQDEGNTVPTVLSDVIKGSLSFGMIIGQCLFGLLGDALGRHHVYGKELILTICGTLLVILMPWKGFPHNSVVAWMSVFRVLTGVGTGGDYPMTSSLSAEQNPWGSRAKLVLLLFATLGLGTRASGIVYLVLLVAFKSAMEDDIYRLQWVWRPLFGIGIIPSVATLYFRLKMPETKPYEKYVSTKTSLRRNGDRGVTQQFRDFHAYFSQWKHAKVLFATCSTWFLFDIAFYGINLNQSVILAQIGYRTGDTPWTTLYNTALGNLIVSGAGFLPGYYVAIFLPDLVGRVCQQVACCLIVTVIYAIWAGVTNHTSTGGLITLFTLSQFFLNVGPSATTFLIPVEVFPTRVRATAHGISAASGKAGALLAAFAFGTVKERIGLPGVLDLFAGIMFLVAILTLLIPETKGKTLEEIEHGMLHRAEAPVPSETDGSGTDLPASKGHNEHVKD